MQQACSLFCRLVLDLFIVRSEDWDKVEDCRVIQGSAPLVKSDHDIVSLHLKWPFMVKQVDPPLTQVGRFTINIDPLRDPSRKGVLARKEWAQHLKDAVSGGGASFEKIA